MSLFDYLTTSEGIALTHALIVLITAAAAYLSYLAHRNAKENAHLLNSHLQEHVKAAQEKAGPPDSA